jgi:hypothetical protein
VGVATRSTELDGVLRLLDARDGGVDEGVSCVALWPRSGVSGAVAGGLGWAVEGAAAERVSQRVRPIVARRTFSLERGCSSILD